MSTKTINLNPYHCATKPDADGFCWEFYAETEGGNKIKVRLHFGFWWIAFLARDLWGTIKRRQDEVDNAKRCMTALQ